MNLSLNKILTFLIFGSLTILAIGLLTSPTILSLSHILMFIPVVYFSTKLNFSQASKSMWALLILVLIIILSVIFNQDIAVNGFKPILKSKYFIFGLLSVVPFSWYFKNYFNEKKLSFLLYLFCIATTFATIFGLLGMYNGYNLITLREVTDSRNAGLFGMLMNYAHNMVYFQIIIFGMIYYRKQTKHYINTNFLISVFVINFIGLYFTYTRGALLALLCGIPFYFFKSNKKNFITIVSFLLLAGIGIYIISGKSIIRPQSDKERTSQWLAAIKAFEERPLLGYGYLNFEHYSIDIKKRYGIGEINFGGHAHSNLFEMLASTGAIGFISFMSWMIFWFWEMYKREGIMSGIGMSFIVVFFISGLTQATISLGINLFFIMAFYSLSQVNGKLLKNNY